jgi:hypothetical protein
VPHRKPNVPDESAETLFRYAVRAGIPLAYVDIEEEYAVNEHIGTDLGGDFPHYIGQRQKAVGGCYVIKVEADGSRTELPPRFDLSRHSPDGFQWGYEGSGPAQLALAICADVLENDGRALELYQSFKRDVIARITHDRFKLTGPDVRAKLEQLEQAAAL